MVICLLCVAHSLLCPVVWFVFCFSRAQVTAVSESKEERDAADLDEAEAEDEDDQPVTFRFLFFDMCVFYFIFLLVLVRSGAQIDEEDLVPSLLKMFTYAGQTGVFLHFSFIFEPPMPPGAASLGISLLTPT